MAKLIPEVEVLIALVDAQCGPAASLELARFAAEKRDEVVERDHPGRVDTWVDGVEGAPLETVRPSGLIRFQFDYMREVISEIFNLLIMRSPYRTKLPSADVQTHYKDEHRIFIDGVDVTDSDILNPASNSVVVFYNIQPYSRKIEKGFSAQALSGVYEQVARIARNKYGKMFSIQFEYMEIPGAGWQTTRGRRSNKAKKAARDDRFPAIVVMPKDLL